jgi:hypothetical protein
VSRTSLEEDAMQSTTVVFSERPMSSMARARLFAQGLKSGNVAKSTESSPPTSLASSFEHVTNTTLTGELVDLQDYLDGFDARLREPRVGEIMDASNATAGRLYDMRRDLAQYAH